METRRCRCAGDAACEAERYCQPAGGECVVGCRLDPDSCPEGNTCDAETRTCGCAEDATCPDEQYCGPNGRCTNGCRLDGCPEGEACNPQTRMCEEAGPACDRDVDCPPEQYCGGGSCRPGCRIGGCGEGQVCDAQTRACGCNEDLGCPDEQYCDEGACVEGCRLAEGACGEGLRCDEESRDCVCASDEGCDAGEYCDGVACTPGCRLEPDDCPGGDCDPMTRRCGCGADADCPGGQFCEDGACAPGCRLNPDDCGEGSQCDPESHTCTCASDEACPEGQYCAPDGTCDAGCRLDPDDCGEGLACDADSRECACASDEACAEGEYCADGSCEAGCRVDPDSCGEGLECDPASHRCRCDSDEACPEEEYCSPGGVCEAGCRLDPDNCAAGVCDEQDRSCGAQRCQRDVDCGEGQACSVFDGEAGLALRCTAALAEGGAEEPCRNGLECGSRICINDAFCFSACVEDADCPSNDCGVIRINDAEFLTCRPPVDACLADGLCEEGEVCLAVGASEEQPNQQRLGCVPDPGALGSGAVCQAHGQCNSDFCLPDEGVCWGPCRVGEADCGAGQVCYDNLLYFIFDQETEEEADDRFWGTPGCAPDTGSGQSCPNGACPGNEVCTPRTNQDRTEFAPQCRDPIGPARGGAICQLDASCQTGTCLTNGFCLGICDPARGGADCAPGALCLNQNFTLWDRGTPANPADDLSDSLFICVPN